MKALDDAGIEYMLTGSIVSSLQGAPRSTHDVDIVVNLSPNQVRTLTDAFQPPQYYFSDSAIAEAIKYRKMFNLLEVPTGQKVDFWMLKDEPFDQSRFGRRRLAQYFGVPVYVSSPEDTILGKLFWSELSGGSEKQFNDVLQVYEVQAARLDTTYVSEWVDKLQVRTLWERVLREATSLK